MIAASEGSHTRSHLRYAISNWPCFATDDWRDNSRDILNFLQFYLPSRPASDVLPTHLPRLSAADGAARRSHGLQDRTIVFIGHSFGGCTLYVARRAPFRPTRVARCTDRRSPAPRTRAALAEPALFRSLFLVDAIVYPLHPDAPRASAFMRGMATGAVQRRDGWTSRWVPLPLFCPSCAMLTSNPFVGQGGGAQAVRRDAVLRGVGPRRARGVRRVCALRRT